jgi:hypothetical protein
MSRPVDQQWGWPLSRGAKLPGLNIWHGVDRPGICETKSYMEKLIFTRAYLSNVKVIMVIMCVPSIELLCQSVMGQIHALKYLLQDTCGACGHILSCHAVKVAASRDSGSW